MVAPPSAGLPRPSSTFAPPATGRRRIRSIRRDASPLGCWAHGIVHDGATTSATLLVTSQGAAFVPGERRSQGRGRGAGGGGEGRGGMTASIFPASSRIAMQAIPGDERVWVQAKGRGSGRCCSTPSRRRVGATCCARVRRSGVLSRHRHPMKGSSWAAIRGRWYLEHDWVARKAASYDRPARSHADRARGLRRDDHVLQHQPAR